MISREFNKTVLIVEDDIPTNKLFQFYLKHEFRGRIISAYNGEEAVEQCRLCNPDLIFMDLSMPVKDGITAIEEIRANSFVNPIIVITNFAKVAKDKCYEVGADFIMAKPVSKSRFINQLRKFYTGDEGSILNS